MRLCAILLKEGIFVHRFASIETILSKVFMGNEQNYMLLHRKHVKDKGILIVELYYGI
jgi:hypothetical protein